MTDRINTDELRAIVDEHRRRHDLPATHVDLRIMPGRAWIDVELPVELDALLRWSTSFDGFTQRKHVSADGIVLAVSAEQYVWYITWPMDSQLVQLEQPVTGTMIRVLTSSEWEALTSAATRACD